MEMSQIPEKQPRKRRSRKLPKSVRPEEWDLLVSKIPSKDKIPLISFLLSYGAGMRISEVKRCKQEHFQSDGMIFIPESKYGVERKVPIPKGWRKEFFKYLPINKSIRTIQRKFEKYKKLAGLNILYTFHSLRHGFATRLLEKGTPINLVSLALGHADISTTGIYVKASPTDLLKSYQENF
jgi:integrase/recombinase XerD